MIVRFSPCPEDLQRLQVGPRGDLVVWDLNQSKEKWLIRQNSSLRGLAVSPDGKLLATGDFDGHTKLYSSVTGATISDLQFDSAINAVVFSPTGNAIISGSLGGTVEIRDWTKKRLDSIVLTNETVLNLAISTDGDTLVATTRSGSAFLLSLLHPRNQVKLCTYDGSLMNEPNAEGVAFASDGQTFATACQNSVRFWKYPSGKLLKEFNSPRTVNSIAFSPDSKSLAVVDTSRALSLWDVMAGQCRIATNAHSGTSFCVAFSPDGNLIATIGRDDFFTKIWDARTLASRGTLTRNRQ